MEKPVRISLLDKTIKEFPAGTTLINVAKGINSKLAKSALAAKINGVSKDMSTPLQQDAELEFIVANSEDGLEILRHSTAHVLAMAVQRLWPGTQVTIGPVISNGFYYDFSFPKDVRINEKDFQKIEREMSRIQKSGKPITRVVVSRNDAIQKFESLGEDYKVDIIKDLPETEEISIYEMDGWFDLCKGPHVPNLGKLGAFKLTSIAGAYWRGDETQAMLTRIYGTAWPSKDELDAYLQRLEEAKRRDHRLLGKELDLFSFHDEAAAHAFFHPRGAFLYQALQEYIKNSNNQFGFTDVITPLMMHVDMWKQSGHYDNYRENMYFTKVDEHEAAIKPMNCPGHCLIYKSSLRSYRDLPLRFAEFGRVHRHERSGVTHGLFRVRSFVQDDAHIFCLSEHLHAELKQVLAQVATVYQDLGFERFRMELSTRPEKSIGSDEVWEKAEHALQAVLQDSGADYRLNPGDGAFYGPKIDFHLIDSLERSWQCGTVQLDFSMPSRFGLEYVGSDNQRNTPIMIHRAVLGSFERFLGILIEHCGGHFPFWLAPDQLKIISIASDHAPYCQEIDHNLRKKGYRVSTDLRNEKLGKKIREAQLQKIPYMAIIGDKELTEKKISLRKSDQTQVNDLTLEQILDLFAAEGKKA